MQELQRMHSSNELKCTKIQPEKPVVVNKHGLRNGSFDFFVETEHGRKIGFEVLTRPSKGKMKEKLAYAEVVDEYVFVLPSEAISFYRKNEGPFKSITRGKFLPKEFARKNLYVWLFDIVERKFIMKKAISAIFNVEKAS